MNNISSFSIDVYISLVAPNTVFCKYDGTTESIKACETKEEAHKLVEELTYKIKTLILSKSTFCDIIDYCEKLEIEKENK